MKKVLIGFYFTVLLSFVSLIVHSQVKDPQVPRYWWSTVRDYIQNKSETRMLTFIHYGEPTDQIIGVFTPGSDIAIQRIDVYARAKVVGDSTAFVMSNGINSTAVVMDSALSATLWFNTTEVIFSESDACTLRFSDDAYSGTFVSGADTPMVVVQYKVAD